MKECIAIWVDFSFYQNWGEGFTEGNLGNPDAFKADKRN